LTRDPFVRLALIAAAVLVGIAGAAALTIVIEPTPPGQERWRRHRQPRDGTAGFERIQS
jgi:hypothetical protein